MVHKLFWQRQLTSLVKFIHLHLFLTLLSLPLLIWWGLQISLASLVGNLVFNVILTCFLSLSSIFFFTELIGIPNAWIVYLFEQVTSWWIWLLRCGSNTWLMGFNKPPVIVLVAIPIAVLLSIHHYKTRQPLKNIATLLAIFFAITMLCKICSTKIEPIEYLPCGKKSIIIATHNNKTTIIDPGSLSGLASSPSWTLFTLVPTLVKKRGTAHIDTLVLCRPTIRTFEAVLHLITAAPITTIILPTKIGMVPIECYRAYQQFLAAARVHHCAIIHLKPNERYCIDKTLPLECTAKKISQRTASGKFNRCKVSSIIDNRTVTFYDTIKSS
jgi:hypothetical protein